MELGKFKLGWPLLILVSLIVGLFVWSFSLFVTNQVFRESSLSNFLATMVGLIIGIPIALWIARRQQTEQEHRDDEVKLREKKQRQVKILSLLKDELQYTHGILKLRYEGPKDKDHYTQSPGVKHDMWSAFLESGQLEWIDDVELMATLGVAYLDIRWIAELEPHFFDPNFYDAIVKTDPGGRTQHTIRGITTINRLSVLTPTAIHKVEKALREIDVALSGQE